MCLFPSIFMLSIFLCCTLYLFFYLSLSSSLHFYLPLLYVFPSVTSLCLALYFCCHFLFHILISRYRSSPDYLLYFLSSSSSYTQCSLSFSPFDLSFVSLCPTFCLSLNHFLPSLPFVSFPSVSPLTSP